MANLPLMLIARALLCYDFAHHFTECVLMQVTYFVKLVLCVTMHCRYMQLYRLLTIIGSVSCLCQACQSLVFGAFSFVKIFIEMVSEIADTCF